MKQPTKSALLLLTFAALLGSAQAAVLTWQGGTGDFADSNWDSDGTPNSIHPGFVALSSTIISSGTINNFNNAVTGDLLSSHPVSISGGAAIFGDFMQIGDAGSNIILSAGSITLSNLNAFRSPSNPFDGPINFTGLAGSSTVTQTDLSGSNNQDLAGKIGASATFDTSFFSIDGTMVASGIEYDGTNLAAVNTALAAKVINDRYFQISESGGAQTLNLVAVPEPSAAALLGLMGSLALLRRRR